VVIGGLGVYKRVVSGEYSEVELLQQLVVKFHDRGKVVAAICAASAVLAKAGILNGVKATCYPDERLIGILRIMRLFIRVNTLLSREILLPPMDLTLQVTLLRE